MREKMTADDRAALRSVLTALEVFCSERVAIDLDTHEFHNHEGLLSTLRHVLALSLPDAAAIKAQARREAIEYLSRVDTQAAWSLLVKLKHDHEPILQAPLVAIEAALAAEPAAQVTATEATLAERTADWRTAHLQPAARCHCGDGGPGDYEGPLRDCPIHGEPAARGKEHEKPESVPSDATMPPLAGQPGARAPVSPPPASDAERRAALVERARASWKQACNVGTARGDREPPVPGFFRIEDWAADFAESETAALAARALWELPT